MKLHHLSHTDTDGYSCQFITSKLFDNVLFYNSNYGKEIDSNLDVIISTITNEDKLLITDLNLSIEQSEIIDNKQKEIGFELELIDHHMTGKPSAEKFEWYKLDVSKCATKLVFERYKNEIKDETMMSHLSIFSDYINAYDLYLEDDKYFNYGKTINGLLMGHRRFFPKPLKDVERELLFKILRTSFTFLMLGEGIPRTEEMIHNSLRSFMEKNVERPDLLPLTTLKAQFLYYPIIEKGMFDNIKIDEYNVEVYFDISDIFQEFSHLRLKKEKDIDIVMSVGVGGLLSLRALTGNEVDVEKIARKYFNGGGHKKASGGSLDKNGYKKISREIAIELIINQTTGY